MTTTMTLWWVEDSSGWSIGPFDNAAEAVAFSSDYRQVVDGDEVWVVGRIGPATEVNEPS